MANPIIDVECINTGMVTTGQLKPAVVRYDFRGQPVYDLAFCVLINNEWQVARRQDWRNINAKRSSSQSKPRPKRTQNDNMENERGTPRTTYQGSKFNRSKP